MAAPRFGDDPEKSQALAVGSTVGVDLTQEQCSACVASTLRADQV